MNETNTVQPAVRRRSLWSGPLILVLIFLLVVVVLAFFFRVSKVEVINASEYTDEEIIEASGIEEGVNLFFVDRFKAASMIFSDLPYMDTVSIRRQIPGKIVIQAEGSAPVASILVDGEYWLIDRRGKMLGAVSISDASGYPEVRDLVTVTAIEGTDMVVDERNALRLESLTAVLTPLKAEGMLPYVQWISVKDPDDPCIRIDGRLTAYLGTAEAMDYKIALLRDVTEKLSTDDRGTLYFAGGNVWNYSPD